MQHALVRLVEQRGVSCVRTPAASTSGRRPLLAGLSGHRTSSLGTSGRTSQSRDQNTVTQCYASSGKSDTDLGPAFDEHPVRRAFLSVGVTNEDLVRAARLEPTLLDYSTDRLHAMLDLLLDAGLTSSDVGQVLIVFPQAFKLSLERGREVTEFLREDVHLNPPEVRTLLTRFPSILGMNVKGQLRPQVAYLKSLGVASESMAGLVLSRPLVLGPGIETVIAFLRRCGLPRSQMHLMLRSYPLDYRMHFKGFSAVAPDGPSSSPGSGGDRGMGRKGWK